MKLKDFKKALNRCSFYRYHTPRINSKIFIREDGAFTYCTCHNLSGRFCSDTKEFFYIIKDKRKRHKKGGEK